MSKPNLSTEDALDALFKKHPYVPFSVAFVVIAMTTLGMCHALSWLDEILVPTSVSDMRIATKAAKNEGYTVLDAQHFESNWREDWFDFEVRMIARDPKGRVVSLRVACRRKDTDLALKKAECDVSKDR